MAAIITALLRSGESMAVDLDMPVLVVDDYKTMLFFGKNDKADIDAAFQYPVDDFVIISLVDKNLDFRIRFLELAEDFRQQPRCVVTRSTFVRI